MVLVLAEQPQLLVQSLSPDYNFIVYYCVGNFCRLTVVVPCDITGNPAEVCLVRMAADTRQPPEQRRNYKNIFDALKRVYQDEGLVRLLMKLFDCFQFVLLTQRVSFLQAALWRGSSPTVARACLLNMGTHVPLHDERLLWYSPFSSPVCHSSGQLGVYSQAKTTLSQLTGLQEGIPLQV